MSENVSEILSLLSAKIDLNDAYLTLATNLKDRKTSNSNGIQVYSITWCRGGVG